MRRLLALTLLLSVGCTAMNRTMLAVSTASLVCDWGQTHHFAAGGWKNSEEINVVLGPKPTTKAVDVYFAGVIFTNVLLWMVMSKSLKSLVPFGVTVVQTDVIINNMPDGGLCGF